MERYALKFREILLRRNHVMNVTKLLHEGFDICGTIFKPIAHYES
jgi:hypothetical protein